MAALCSLAVVAFLLTGASCLQFSENLPGHIQTCEGNDVTFGWALQPSPQDRITSMEWFFHGRSQEMIAFLSHDLFVPLPAFADRVEHGSGGTLTIRHVTQEDSGNYTIEIDGQDPSGSAITLTDTVYVQVEDNLMTSNHQLQVTQSPQAVYNGVTEEWSLQLSCGNFTYLGQPPLAVEWLSPSGGRYNSSSYGDGQYHWLVPNPVEEGSYTCLIPSRYVHVLCLPPGTSQGPEATLAVDDLKVRMMLMEAEQRSLRADNRQLAAENQVLAQDVATLRQDNLQLKAGNQLLAQNLSTLLQDNLQLKEDNQLLAHSVSVLQQDNVQLKADTQRFTQNLSSLQQHMTSGQAAPGQGVSFHAKLTFTQHLQPGDRLVLATVRSNHGNAYNGTAGVFTAPYDGTYFFIASTASVYSSFFSAEMEVLAEGVGVGRAFARSSDPYPHMATCHAVVGLTAGQRVWLHTSSEGDFNALETYFSGFLV